jgi:hypothetical protein
VPATWRHKPSRALRRGGPISRCGSRPSKLGVIARSRMIGPPTSVADGGVLGFWQAGSTHPAITSQTSPHYAETPRTGAAGATAVGLPTTRLAWTCNSSPQSRPTSHHEHEPLTIPPERIGLGAHADIDNWLLVQPSCAQCAAITKQARSAPLLATTLIIAT